MGRLNKIIKELETEVRRVLTHSNPNTVISRVLIKKIVRENDSTLFKTKADYAVSYSQENRYRPNKEDMIIRKAHPGLFDVVFINRHTKERQRLTKEKGIFYDVALYYFNYITDYVTEQYNEIGHYEITEKKLAFLPADEHFGI